MRHWHAPSFLVPLLLIAGCPDPEVPIESDGDSSGTTSGTNPTATATVTVTATITTTIGATTDDTTTTLDTCGTACGVDSTSTGPVDPDTTGGTTGTTDGTTGTTGGSTDGTTGTTGGSTDGTTGTTGGTTDGGTTTTGVIFIVPDTDTDGGLDCDPWLQDCPAGEKCNAWDDTGGGSWNANGCFPIDPAPVGVGDVCTVVGSGTSGIDNCELGAMCWGVDGVTNEGTCVALCTGSEMAPVCPAGSSCSITNGGVLILCLPGCDPLLQDCAAGDACYPVGDEFTCVPDASGAAGADGDPCEFINVCDPGLMCASPASLDGCFSPVGCCTPFCDVTAPIEPCPSPAEDCVAFYDPGMAPPGFDDVGVCVIP